ncbi:hypothetical protein [Anaerosolibacter sp.]|uniref:hypothetical protein n=1 Tax=Anaerosolibacter sp. TaxID=1872527 RepID=UPI0039EE8A21
MVGKPLPSEGNNNAIRKVKAGQYEGVMEKIESIGKMTGNINHQKNELVEVIEAIWSVAQTASAATEEATASMEQQSAAAEEVSQEANALNELAVKLAGDVSRFKTK